MDQSPKERFMVYLFNNNLAIDELMKMRPVSGSPHLVTTRNDIMTTELLEQALMFPTACNRWSFSGSHVPSVPTKKHPGSLGKGQIVGISKRFDFKLLRERVPPSSIPCESQIKQQRTERTDSLA